MNDKKGARNRETCKHDPRNSIVGLERICIWCHSPIQPVRCHACGGERFVGSGRSTRACVECTGTGVARWEVVG